MNRWWIGGSIIIMTLIAMILYFAFSSSSSSGPQPFVLTIDNPYDRNPDGTPNNILIEHSFLPPGFVLSDRKRACILKNRQYADKIGSQYYSVYKDDEDFRNAIDRCLQTPESAE